MIAAGEQLVGRGHRGGRHLPHQQLSQPGARAARRGDPARSASPTCWSRRPTPCCRRCKEYERTSTTVVNAYLLPAMRSYLRNLEAGLRCDRHRRADPVMTSNGGMLAADTACEKPVFVVASGPAGGVIGAARLGAARGEPRPHRLRHGRHDGQGRDHRGRPAQHDIGVRVPRRHLDVEPLRQGRRLHAQGAGHRHRRGRRRRRLARAASTRAACWRSGRSRPAPCRARPATASATTGRP